MLAVFTIPSWSNLAEISVRLYDHFYGMGNAFVYAKNVARSLRYSFERISRGLSEVPPVQLERGLPEKRPRSTAEGIDSVTVAVSRISLDLARILTSHRGVKTVFMMSTTRHNTIAVASFQKSVDPTKVYIVAVSQGDEIKTNLPHAFTSIGFLWLSSNTILYRWSKMISWFLSQCTKCKN